MSRKRSAKVVTPFILLFGEATAGALPADKRALEILAARFTPEEIERGAGSTLYRELEIQYAERGEPFPVEMRERLRRWHDGMMEAQAAKVKIRKGPEASKKSKRNRRERDYAKYRRELITCLRHNSSGPNPIATAVKTVAKMNKVSERTIRRATVEERQRITKEVGV